MQENLEQLVKEEGFGYAGKRGNVLYLADITSFIEALWLLPEEPKYIDSFKKSVSDNKPVYLFVSVDTKSGEVCAEGVGTSVDNFKNGKYYSRINYGEKGDNIMKSWIYQNEGRIKRAMSNPNLKLTLGKKFDWEVFL